MGYFGGFIISKVYGKITAICIYNGVKYIKYTKDWHMVHDSYFDKFLEWVLI